MSWKQVLGYEDIYEVSDTGLIRSVTRMVGHNSGGLKKLVGKESKVFCDKQTGYLKVKFSRLCVAKTHNIHRLVATAFVPNPFNMTVVNHLDGNKLNNNDWNLEWTDSKGNVIHAFKSGLMRRARGSDHSKSKLTREQVSEIYKRYHVDSHRQIDLAKEYKVSHSTIHTVVTKKRKES